MTRMADGTARHAGEHLVERYRANYGLPADALLTEEMVHEHWDLERALRTRLLEAEPEDRWAVFDRSYSELYRRLSWLNDPDAESSGGEAACALWAEVIGAPPRRIYEVGSGRGGLIASLAARGHRCRATEITRERGERLSTAHANLTWGSSDGVHLDQFEQPGSYDVVISDQVVEHLHPDDVAAHLRGVHRVLVPGGRYVFATPHRASGPHDVSRVFQADAPMGMHLREYTYAELVELLDGAGFTDVKAVFRLPAGARRRLRVRPVTSRAYLRYLRGLEGALLATPIRWRPRVTRAARLLLFAGGIMLVASKRGGLMEQPGGTGTVARGGLARIRDSLERRGLGGTLGTVLAGARPLVLLREEHVWYALDLHGDRPRRPLPPEVELVRAEASQWPLASAMDGGPDADQIREFSGVGGELWMVLDGGRAAFTCWVFPRVTPAIAARGGWLHLPPSTVCLENSATSPGHRGRGIAPGAWSAIADGLSGRGVETMITKVAVDNVPSRKAVSKAGFTEVAVMHLRRLGPRTRIAVSPSGPGLSSYLADTLQR